MAALLAAAVLILQLLCQLLVTVECGGPLPSGYVRYPPDNTAYKIFGESVKWKEARDRCISEGAELAVVATPQKIEHVMNVKGRDQLWIGIHRPSGKGGNWVRVDTGLPVASLPWGDIDEDETSNCAVTWDDYGDSESLTINNLPCSHWRPFVCEISLAEGCAGQNSQTVHQESTAKTCRDLFLADPNKPSGEYWIDPNGGDASDKILVHCDAEDHSTCIKPKINQSQVITYAGKKQQVWLSEHETGMQIAYTADDHQMNALQCLSRHAEQKVTYHCMKSVGYFDAEGRTHGRGLKLSAWTEVELTPRGRRRLRYEVISDECQNRSNDWQETVIAYRTSRPVLLPVLDVALRDLGGPDKKAIVEIGEVCFS